MVGITANVPDSYDHSAGAGANLPAMAGENDENDNYSNNNGVAPSHSQL